VSDGVLRSGFKTYLDSGEFTAEFLSDVDAMITKVYRHWSLYEDEDEFRGFCMEKLVRAMKTYEDGGREIGPLSTYLFQVITNEARRVYSKHKKMTCYDISVAEYEPMWGVVPDDESDTDFVLRSRLCSFAQRAFVAGVFVDQGKVYKNYRYGFDTPVVRAFKWSIILELI
jgi:hypothetical protein